MAVDTAVKRRSIIMPMLPFRPVVPAPDGTIAQADRQTIPYYYSGILFEEVLNEPIFWQIIDKLETLIDTYMTQANGFSLDYGSVNEYDPSARSYPAVYFDFPETISEDDIQVIERDSETTELTIKVQAASTADLDKTAYWVINDFGYLLEEFNGTLRLEGLMDYELLSTEYDYVNINAYPVEIKMVYRFKYRRQDAALYTPDTTDIAEVFSGSAFADSTPIIMSILDQIEAYIDGMLKANNYNFDYGSVNEYDPSARTYPAVYLTYKEETGNDDNEDEMLMYYNTVTHLQIHVIAGSATQVDKKLLLVRSDMQKMFKDNESTLNGLGMERAEYAGTEQSYRLCAAYPWEMIVNYNIYHRRLKNNPYHA